ncbi:sodium/myo-inositol cotransporter-like [Thunnus thynnus]|uniref:sodium/myo-inositol cotransporter-like n=1 Tax=Thunnus thynnus TaxID=8237 RepID=UPI001C4C19B7|nr:sodium/myo-inositol cotransporter-like isoform X1 [Thunnus maccoyii]XP_042260565.1 sodium/myo-inositol cotransporter-like isoform X1 [Thunnus maccoyii]
MATMEAADIIVVAIYFILVLAIGFLAMWKANRSTVSGYFLAGRSMNWAAVGASLFVSNIGSEHFIGLAGSGAASGFSVAAWEFNALLLLQLLGWVFIPVYIQSGVYTMPEYLSKRYGGRRLKVYFAALSLVLYIFTKLSVDLYSGALFIHESLGWNLYLSIILLISMTALLTITGGLVAVIYTDTVQAFLMIAGALCLTGISLFKVGGLEGVRTKYMEASPNITAIFLSSPNLTYSEICHHHHLHPKQDSLKILRGPRDPDLPWPGFLLGQTPASIWYWCADQVIVQRVLAAKNIAHAKGSTIMAGFLKILPMFIIVIPGMISRILFADELACISPEHCMEVCGSAAGCSNVAYPRLVMSVMPVGLRGLMMAVMIAALMSDLDSIFNSASTIFTLDIYKMLRKQVSSRELVIVGRLFVVFMVIISIAWVPVIIEMQGGQMFYYIQEVSDYLTPPIAALFLLGILWHRCNETGAFWGGMVGFTLGALRLVLALVYREPRCNQPDERPAFIKDVHFMYVAGILFWVSALVTVIVSLCTPPPGKEQIRTTTLWGLNKRKRLKQQEKEAGEDMTTLKPLNHAILNGNTLLGKEKCQDHSNKFKGIEANHENAQQSNGHAIAVNDIEIRPIQNGHSLISDPKMVEEAGGIGVRDGDEEEQGCFGGGEVESGKCMKVLEWFCGFQEKPSKSQVITVQEQEKILDELLHEPPRTKIILNIGLVVICSVGIFLFIYFSL